MATQIKKETHHEDCERTHHDPADHTAGVEKPWQTFKSAMECHRYKFEQQLHCDVWFTVNKPEPTKIGAHKYMLMTRSSVFETMFADLNQSLSHVTIDDIEVQNFNQLLKYIYTDEVDLQTDNVLNLFCAAEAYDLNGLAARTKDYLAQVLDDQNIWLFLQQSALLENCDMKHICIDFAARKITCLLKKEEFLNLSQDLLLEILTRDELCTELETDVYFACVSWAKNKAPEGREPTDSDLRQILGPCFHNIRFAAMTLELFGSTGGRSGILSDNEKLALFCYISNHEKQTELKTAGFNIIPRYLQNACNLYDPSNVSISTSSYQIGTNKFEMRMDKEINIQGIIVLSCGKSESYDLTIIISETYDTYAQMYSAQRVIKQIGKVTTQNTSPYLPIQLDEAINLKPGKTYEITVDPKTSLDGCVTRPKYRAHSPRFKVQAQNVKFIIKKYQNCFITSILFNRV